MQLQNNFKTFNQGFQEDDNSRIISCNAINKQMEQITGYETQLVVAACLLYQNFNIYLDQLFQNDTS